MIKKKLANISVEDFELIMSSVFPHSKSVKGRKGYVENVLDESEICYWEILNAIEIEMINQPDYNENKNNRNWKQKFILDKMQLYRSIYIVDFIDCLKGKKATYLKNYNFPVNKYLDFESVEPYFIAHYANLFGYSEEKEFNKTDIANLGYVKDDGYVLYKRLGGCASERTIIESLVNKIQTQKYTLEEDAPNV